MASNDINQTINIEDLDQTIDQVNKTHYINQNEDNQMAFGPPEGKYDLPKGQLTQEEMELVSVQLSKIRYEEVSKLHSYWCFTLLVLVSLSNTLQRSAIGFMFSYQSAEDGKTYDQHYSIRDSIPDFTPENYTLLVGDYATILYAFMVLFTGGLSDLFNRKKLLCWSSFAWCLATYLTSYCTNFHQIYVLRLIMSFFTAFSGPCSYSLMSDWILPEHRTFAYALYALGVQFGGPISPLSIDLIDQLGWRATFQFVALIGFALLAVCLISFDEPDRGRFDIAQSLVNNPENSMKTGSKYNKFQTLSEKTTQLGIQQAQSESTTKFQFLADYYKGLKELFSNEAAFWILFAACLRTQQGIAMSLFTNEFFRVYPGREQDYQLWSTIAGLVGAFVCTLGTAIISDSYDNINYMTKAYMCMVTTLISIPCCLMTYMVTDSFWISMTGLFIEYMLSTAWGQPAIGILSTVCDASVRGTAISLFFFLISIFGVIAPYGYLAIQNHYGLDPYEEPFEFGVLVSLCTCIPCIVALPCFYVAGVKYSWHKYHEAMFMLDVWGEMEQFYEDEITRKRFNQMTGDPAEKSILSASIDWKIRQEKRKIKHKDIKTTLNYAILNQFKEINNRNKKLENHSQGEEQIERHHFDEEKAKKLIRKTQIVAEMPDDMTQKGFNYQPILNKREDSMAHQIGPDGKPIPHSFKEHSDNSLLNHYRQTFIEHRYGYYNQYQY